ncbi:MAG: transcription factor [Methanobrevibacter sp.]|jgi:transcription initiation factor TFIIE subunit alpha|nr:transcription factor [Candidatus Methanoflexus mossambicus]
MLKNRLIKEFLNDIGIEKEELEIVKCLESEADNDEDIASKTNIKINTVRKVLYKLHDSGLATYKRSKNPETNWYTYAWTFNKPKVKTEIKHKHDAKIIQLETKLEYEQNNMFFICPKDKVRFDFNTISLPSRSTKGKNNEKETGSSSNAFKCPNCGTELEFQDNDKIIKSIEKEIQKTEKAFENFQKKF